jgi:hypothetical protein
MNPASLQPSPQTGHQTAYVFLVALARLWALPAEKALSGIEQSVPPPPYVPPDFSGRRICRDSPWQAGARISRSSPTKGLFVIRAAVLAAVPKCRLLAFRDCFLASSLLWIQAGE